MVSNLSQASYLTTIEEKMVDKERRPRKPRAPWGTLRLSKNVRDEDDIYDYEYRLANAFSVLDRSEKIGARGKELIRNFDNLLQATSVSTGRRAKYLFHLRTIGENLNVEFEQAKRSDIEHFMAWLNSQKYSPYTRVDYITILKRFYKFIRKGTVDKEEPFPEEVRWLRKTIKPNEKKNPEFLTGPEVKQMIMASDRLRDKAMLAVGFEAGLRATELLLLNVSDVSFDERGAKVTVRYGKTGARVVRLISSSPTLSAFMEVHPRRSDPTAPLWPSESTNYRFRRLSWQSWDREMKRVGRTAGIPRRRIHNHMLRHGSATDAAKFLSESELKIRYGWSPGSRMPAVYVHLSGQDLDDKLARMYSGREIKPTRSEFAPLLCVRCGEPNTPSDRYCRKCATPLDSSELERSRLEPQMIQSELAEMKSKIQRLLASKSVN